MRAAWTLGRAIRPLGHSPDGPRVSTMLRRLDERREAMVLDVIARYHQALGERDFGSARALMRDDLRFTGPFESFESADAYLAALQQLWGIVESLDVRHVSASGNEVVALYDMATRTPAGTQLVCEWYGVEDGSIAWLRAVFDTAPFAFLREGG